MQPPRPDPLPGGEQRGKPPDALRLGRRRRRRLRADGRPPRGFELETAPSTRRRSHAARHGRYVHRARGPMQPVLEVGGSDRGAARVRAQGPADGAVGTGARGGAALGVAAGPGRAPSAAVTISGSAGAVAGTSTRADHPSCRERVLTTYLSQLHLGRQPARSPLFIASQTVLP